jgi:hypothetical protein
MKCPYHLVQAGQTDFPHDAHTFDSALGTTASQHAHRA